MADNKTMRREAAIALACAFFVTFAKAVRELVVIEELQPAQQVEGVALDPSDAPIPDMTVADRSEGWVAVLRFQTALSGKRKYPVQQFKSFEGAARRYIELSKDDPLIHRNVAQAINGLTAFLEVEWKNVPGDVLREAERLECLLFGGYDPHFEGDEPPGL